jgi:inner membrane protein
MDPLTQGVVGAALPLATRGRSFAALAGSLGFAAGMTADLDILIRSDTDALLFLEYHRQFSHALVFVPVGGLITASCLYAAFRRFLPLSFLATWLFCTLGYATHGLLDAATSYGTMLFWPFSDERVSWSIISVVDPLFTIPVLGLTAAGVIRRRGLWGRLALVWAAFYLTLGAFQHHTALAKGRELAAERGHAPIRLEVKPSFANLLVWKLVYETEEHFHVDAVRAGLDPVVVPGESLTKLDLARDFPWLRPDTQQARDIDRFSYFSDGYVARDPRRPNHVIDVRYSFVPNSASPLWSIRLSPEGSEDTHVAFETHRGAAREGLRELWRLIASPPG